MAINGLGALDIYSSYYSRNPLEKFSANPLEAVERRNADSTSVKENKQDELASPVEESVKKPLSLNLDAIKTRPNASLENISLSMKRPAESIETGKRDVSLSALDMEKAVSDMQKDQALMQYTFFVGDSNIISQDEDGTVIQKIPQEMN